MLWRQGSFALLRCLFIHYSDQISEGSEVLKVALCVKIQKWHRVSQSLTKVRYRAARAAKKRKLGEEYCEESIPGMRVLCPKEGQAAMRKESLGRPRSPAHRESWVGSASLHMPAQLISRVGTVKPFSLDSCPYVGGTTHGLGLLVWMTSGRW